MPRRSRIGTPGALHHIIARGIAHKKIFHDNHDRNNFLDRLGGLLKETQTLCFAWVLILNHSYLFVRTGDSAIRQRILDYNEDDCIAMRVLLDAMEGLPIKII